MVEAAVSEPLKRTPLHDLHLRLGARMVPFAGYDMPVQYPSGIIKEHLHTRSAAGLFDVSHMGQIALRSRSGSLREAALALETLVPVDVLGLPPGRQRYALFTNATGGIRDDLMVTNLEDHLFLVVNAACKDADLAHLSEHLSETCTVEPLQERALLALQGPASERVLAALLPNVTAMRFMDVRVLPWRGDRCVISRSGYTGEDGFEISVRNEYAVAFCEALLSSSDVAPAGLGARDSLRLEAGLCLYGADLDPTTTPVEAALEWAIQAARRSGGARAGGYPGADIILSELAQGATRRRVGLKPEGRAPVRGGAPLFRTESDEVAIGTVTSGGYGVSLEAPIAMGYVPSFLTAAGTRLFADVRDKRLPVQVCDLPFVALRYRRSSSPAGSSSQ
ncbi:MAG: glycine cleavage system aminomethyltransferase GcvT [Hyphomicrobiales bacterium]|nr:glycine cleavage system aminomethyltransferase GcvT [Hyphomicrobiales bacterium]